jgi:hypothetical protein
VTLFAQLNGTPIVRGSITIPFTGIWHADVWLDRVSDTSGPQSLVVNGLTGTCAVVRQIDFAGESMLRLVGGAGGWSKPVPTPAFYASPNLATILEATALAVGEKAPNVATDRSVDPFYVVDNQGPASAVLADLLGDTWWMDLTGTIQTGPRSTPTIASPFVLRQIDGPAGIYHVESDTITDWMPGASFSCPTGSGVVSRVRHAIDGGKLSTEVMIPTSAATPLDRLRQVVEEVLAAYLPDHLYLATWEYKVTSSSGGPSSVTIDAQPVDPRLPPVSGLPLRADASGSVATPAIGSSVLVGFIGGDRASPEIRGLDGGTGPTALWIGQGTNPIARLGDQVQAFLPPMLPFTGTSSSGPVTGVITAAAPISGVITQGSTTGQVQ